MKKLAAKRDKLVAARTTADDDSRELVSTVTGRLLVRIYRRLGVTYPDAAVAFQLLSGLPIGAVCVGVMLLYLDIETDALIRFCGAALVLIVISYVLGVIRGHKALRPVRRWLKGERTPESTREAWEAAIQLPAFYLREPLYWLIGIAGPAAAIGYFTLDLSTAEAAAVFLGATLGIAYAGVGDYFSLEGLMRPVVADIAAALPMRTEAEARGVPVKWKLLVALPVINVVTGVVVASLTSPQSEITALAVDILVATAVALTISLVLLQRVVGAMLRPLGDLGKAIELVEAGRLDIAVPITSGDEIGRLARAFNSMVAGLAERERIRETFGTFVDPDVAEHVLADPDAVGGEEAEVTVLFLDVRGFTGWAEEAEPPQVVETLNRLFSIAVPIVTEHGGHIDKFVGDGVMAVFGAPRRLDDHADRALASACKISAEVRDEFGDELKIGVGLNSGSVVAGSIGAEGRLEYSVIGDAVNVAARVEAATRETGDDVLLTGSTQELLSDGADLEQRGEVALKGRSAPVIVFAPGDGQTG